MPYYELEFSHGPETTQHYACIHAAKRPTPEEITLNYPNLVAGFSAPCASVKRITKADAVSFYDEII